MKYTNDTEELLHLWLGDRNLWMATQLGKRELRSFVQRLRLNLSKEYIELLSEPAWRVLVCAHQESFSFGHMTIGTEHIVLGLVMERSSAAAAALMDRNACLRQLRVMVDEMRPPLKEQVEDVRDFSRRAKDVLSTAVCLGSAGDVSAESILVAICHDAFCRGNRLLRLASMKVKELSECFEGR